MRHAAPLTAGPRELADLLQCPESLYRRVQSPLALLDICERSGLSCASRKGQ
jgi:hypothetical protein